MNTCTAMKQHLAEHHVDAGTIAEGCEAMDHAENQRDSFGCAPQQYHAGLDKLWAAMPWYTKPTDEDVFTLAAREIERVQSPPENPPQAEAENAPLAVTIYGPHWDGPDHAGVCTHTGRTVKETGTYCNRCDQCLAKHPPENPPTAEADEGPIDEAIGRVRELHRRSSSEERVSARTIQERRAAEAEATARDTDRECEHVWTTPISRCFYCQRIKHIAEVPHGD